MSTEFTLNIDVDIYNRKLIVINAKQYDKETRYLLLSCFADGNFMELNSMFYGAMVRVKKPDGRCVFNNCTITEEGKILVELTEQILAAHGNAIVDVVIFSVDYSDGVTENNVEIEIEEGSIVSTIPFRINVIKSACDCWDVESTNEFDALNHAVIQAHKNYYDVMSACKVSEDNMVAITKGLGGMFSPQQTITFAELSTVSKAVGFVYHISEEFVTDATFKCGAGITIPKGTNVYWTADGYWDYLVDGMLVPTDDGEGNVDLSWQSYFDSTLKSFDDGEGNVVLHTFCGG